MLSVIHHLSVTHLLSHPGVICHPPPVCHPSLESSRCCLSSTTCLSPISSIIHHLSVTHLFNHPPPVCHPSLQSSTTCLSPISRQFSTNVFKPLLVRLVLLSCICHYHSICMLFPSVNVWHYSALHSVITVSCMNKCNVIILQLPYVV